MLRCAGQPKGAASEGNRPGRRSQGGEQLATRVSQSPPANLDDVFEAHLASCQRRSAQRMLDDFEKSGVDEDLEQLKAGWAPSFSRRGGAPARKNSGTMHALPASAMGYDCAAIANVAVGGINHATDAEEPIVSNLAVQAGLARDRLLQLDALRSIAMSDANGAPADEGKDRPPRQNCALPRRQVANKSQAPADDPWDSWEARWSEEFNLFEEFERAKHVRTAAQAQEAYSRREAEWRRKVEHVKSQAEAAARRGREAQPPRPKQPQETRDAQQRQERQKPKPRQPEKPREPPRSSGSASRQARREQPGAGQEPGKAQRGYSSSDSSSSPPPRASAAPKNPPPRTSSPPKSPPPRTSAAPKRAPQASALRPFATFGEFEAAWSKFERAVDAGKPIRCADVPWPTALPTVSGVSAGDNAAERKKMLRAALVRWHPDKWGSIFALVCEEDSQIVMEKVKEVTRRIIDERKLYGG